MGLLCNSRNGINCENKFIIINFLGSNRVDKISLLSLARNKIFDLTDDANSVRV